MRKILLSMCVVAVSVQGLGLRSASFAETTINKVQDQVGDTKTDSKKAVRTTNRKIRKATGNDNVLKDLKDKANDAGDDVSNGTDKIKRKNK